MVAFSTQGDLRGYLQRLGALYSQYTQKLWEYGVRSSLELANASPATLRKAGVTNDLHLENIKASAAKENGVTAAAAAPASTAKAPDNTASGSAASGDGKAAGNTGTAPPAANKTTPAATSMPASKGTPAGKPNGQAASAPASRQGGNAVPNKTPHSGGNRTVPGSNKRPVPVGYRPPEMFQRHQWRSPTLEQAPPQRMYSAPDAGRGRPMAGPPPAQYPPHFHRPQHGNSVDPMQMNSGKRQRTAGGGPGGQQQDDKYLPPHLPPHLPPPPVYQQALMPPPERGGGMLIPMPSSSVNLFQAQPPRPMQRLPPPQAPSYLGPPALSAPPLMGQMPFGQSLPPQQQPALFPSSWQQQQQQPSHSNQGPWQQQQQQQQLQLQPGPTQPNHNWSQQPQFNYQEW